MSASKLLFQKAKLHKSAFYQLKAKVYSFESYTFSGLPEEGYRELEEASKLISRLNENVIDDLVVKAELFVSYSNYYFFKGDFENQLKYVKLSGKEYDKIKDKDKREYMLYFHYSNMGGVYNDLNNLDSAKYFLKLSQSIDKEYNYGTIQFNNLSFLGEVEMKQGNYEKAVYYFHEAEKVQGYKNHFNIQTLYENIIFTYQQLQKQDSISVYESKMDSLKLVVSENQNKSLHGLLNETKKNNPGWYMYLLGFFIFVLALITILMARKNRILSRQEIVSQQYLQENAKYQKGEDHTKLLELLRKNDPAFMTYFNEVFPDFSQKLLAINPNLIQSEIEFCALLKLKVSTKDIAKYKYIEPKTVRNRKYLIRKKLNIPTEFDIYQWFDAV